MKRKLNNISDCQHIPPPPEQKPLSIEDTCRVILDMIKPFTPSDQNKILESINNQVAAARHDAYMKARDDEKQAGQDLDRFMSLATNIQEFVKARQAAKELSR